MNSAMDIPPCVSFLTRNEADGLYYGQRVWYLASDKQMSRKARTAKTKNGIPVITANWLPGTVHGINKRGVQVCPDGARKGTHIWFVGWLQICTETPLNNHIWADERRFCDSTPRSDVNWKTEQ